MFPLYIAELKFRHVKTFPTYKSKLEEIERFSSISYYTTDPIATSCKSNGEAYVIPILFTDLCIKLNKYFHYYTNLKAIDSKHYEYINYWLNKKKKVANGNVLYEKILSGDKSLNILYNSVSPLNDEYQSKFHHLSDEVVRKIDILNELNEQYLFFITKKKIGETFHTDLCDYLRKFANKYNEEVRKCFNNFDNKYCKELIEFKIRYNKYANYIKTCDNINPLTSIPGAQDYELAALKKYSLIEDDSSNSVVNILINVAKVLGGVAVLFLIVKYAPLKSLRGSRKRKKKKDYDHISKDKSYQGRSRGEESYGGGSYGGGSYGHGSYGIESYMDDSYGNGSYGDNSYGYASHGYESYGYKSYGDGINRDGSYRNRSYQDRSYQDRSYQDRSNQNDSYYYEEEDPREYNRRYNIQYRSAGEYDY
ncbi:hypothetical protein, conserved [Plasmodium gonderi]|uniref:Variable surface protein n=1 Tax=Plasmodium gonderi TaxID=77519 RepID=A0A1Y1JQW4_PLAGO|nr:hypothetical protein, conserved [Plasmodium gonderi]GAW83895.1 hypothetical protein, conserved [Plasmodium gonderi]